MEGTLGRLDTLQGTDEIWEKNPSVPVNADETRKASFPSGSPPTAAPRKSSSSPQRKQSTEQHQPRADDVSTPQRPPRRPSLLRDSNGRPDSVSPRPPDDPGGNYGGSHVVRKRSNASSRSTKSSIADRQEVTTRHVVELTALPTSDIGDLVSTLQREVSSTRDHETKDAIDSKLADLEQELKSAKVLIKDLHHEIDEKQEALFKEIVSEKEKQWAEEREKLLLKINEKDVHLLTAQTSTEFAAIQEKLGALHEVLASLNLKADSAHSIERAEEGIARLNFGGINQTLERLETNQKKC
ncbi:hypothetical protein MRX96_004958 [Rhipicephalus microplus]